MNQAANRRYRQGEAILRQVGLDAGGFAAKLDDIAPGLADFIVEAAFGTILNRPGLDLRTREIVTVGTLTALGHAPGQLKTHIRCALCAGATQTEIVEAIVQTCLYAGIPTTLNALAVARDEFVSTGSACNPALAPRE